MVKQYSVMRYSVAERTEADIDKPASFRQEVFLRVVAEIHAGRYNKITRDGRYIIDRGNVVMITDGDYKAPSLDKVYVINTDYEREANTIKEWLIHAERGLSTGYEESCDFIRDTFGARSFAEYGS